jgi:hypothetical protein
MKCVLSIISILFWTELKAQPIPDTTYRAPIKNAYYNNEHSSVVCIDEAHFNFHTAIGGYMPFAQVLRDDGCLIERGTELFSHDYLNHFDVMVVSNALHFDNFNRWTLPTPSAFNHEEIDEINHWVLEGGSLLLIADHMPFAGAAADLARSFGFTFYNGFAMDMKNTKTHDEFRTADQSLNTSWISAKDSDILLPDSVATFTGQAFDCPKEAIRILTLPKNYVLKLPEVAWEFQHQTMVLDASGKSQGAILEYGKGRVAVFGEAAMFTAQMAGNSRVGMNTPFGSENYRLLLHVMHWLKK